MRGSCAHVLMRVSCERVVVRVSCASVWFMRGIEGGMHVSMFHVLVGSWS